jgi:carotenoid 1,2-hydratase
LSDDGLYGLTLIAFVGSVFSPYYAWARRRGLAVPTNHCAVNVALYGPRSNRWSMTERGSSQVCREAALLSIGNSTLRWAGDALEIDLNEVCAPVPRAVRGKIRVLPSARGVRSFALDGGGLHCWTPYAPCARVELQLCQPSLNWSGTGYLDANSGAEPLENAFRYWTWSRASLADSTVVFYDVNSRSPEDCNSDAARSLALRCAANGSIEEIDAPPATQLPLSGWRVPRRTRADSNSIVRVVKTLEDGPFYNRTLLDAKQFGAHRVAFHESLDLDRFRSRWVQCLLPFRMPRIAF